MPDLDPAEVSGTSDEAVTRATGKPWHEWMGLLDAAGGREMNHKQLVAHLVAQDVGPWWQQQIAVAYENSRGLRAKHEMVDGYQISRSRTMPVPAERLYDAWLNEEARRRWLPDADFTVRKATAPKSIRLAWADGSRVDIDLNPKGPEKTTMVVQHNKLPDAEAAARMKAYWAAALDNLEATIE